MSPVTGGNVEQRDKSHLLNGKENSKNYLFKIGHLYRVLLIEEYSKKEEMAIARRRTGKLGLTEVH